MQSTILAVIFLLERVGVARGKGSEKEERRSESPSEPKDKMVGGERKRVETQSTDQSVPTTV